MMSYRRSNDGPGLEVEDSTAGASGDGDLGPQELAEVFAAWANSVGILSRVTEDQCRDLADAFMAGVAYAEWRATDVISAQ